MVGNWLHFTGRQGKRKRAELVCVLCHTKKTKCDLQVWHLPVHRILHVGGLVQTLTAGFLKSRNRQGHQKCSNCDAPDRECHVRPSKRAKQRPNSNTNLEFRNIGPDASVSPGVLPNVASSGVKPRVLIGDPSPGRNTAGLG